jgi:hypothetical protein
METMTAVKPGTTDVTSNLTTLAVVVRRDVKGPALAREVVTEVDLTDARSELWLEHFLRKGRTEVPLDALSFRTVPLLAGTKSTRCTGFALEADGPDGATARCEFSIYSLSVAARRAGDRLVEMGVLKNLEEFYFELYAEPTPTAVQAEPVAAGGTFVVKTKPLQVLRVPLSKLKKDARVLGPADDNSFPVFYTASALAKAERFSRQGARRSPAVETGACLLGLLVSCPDSGEFGCVVLDAIEVMDSEQKQFSLSYSSKSWMRLHSMLAQMQAAHPKLGLRMVGQSHGHNWLPNDGEMCANCLKLEVCTSNNVFASIDDRIWMSAVHTREPFALCHIFGRAARGDEMQKLFGLKDARLIERSYYLIPHFDPTSYEK